jgi:hypothetical protein
MKVAKWMTCVVVAGALAFGCAVATAADGEGKKAEGKKVEGKAAAVAVELSKAAGDAVKAAFPNATQKKVSASKDGKMFNVGLLEGTKEFMANVTDAGVIVSVSTRVQAADLPKAVADAAAAGLPGGTVSGGNKVEQRADSATLAKLDKPVVTYSLYLAKDDTKGMMVVAEDGKVVKPFEARQAKPAGEKKDKPAEKPAEKK